MYLAFALGVCATLFLLFNLVSSVQVPLLNAALSQDGQLGHNVKSSKIITPEISEYIRHALEENNVKGATIAVVRSNYEDEYGAWGVRTEDGETMTAETLFGIASCSKAFLATSIGILMDDFAHGRNTTPLPRGLSTFDWETKVKDLLPADWKLQDKWATEKANVRDILSMVSGLPRHDFSPGPRDSTYVVVRRMRYLRLAYELREKFAYSNQMYMVGAHIISEYAGSYDPSYSTFAKKRIFAPLGMNSTTFSPTTAHRSGNLTQSWTAHAQRIPHSILEESVRVSAGNGGIITSVVDLSKWLKMLLNEGVDPVTNKIVVPKSAFSAVTTATAIVYGKSSAPMMSIVGYGMGWMRLSYMGREAIFHTGGIPGSSTIVLFFPHEQLGMAVLLNAGDKPLLPLNIALKVATTAFGLTDQIVPFEDLSALLSTSSKPQTPTLLQNVTPPSLALSDYSGTYFTPGYGAFTLCDSSTNSSYCESVLSAFDAVDAARSDPQPPPRTIPQLFAEKPRLFATHARFVHRDADSFDLAFTMLFPEGYGASRTPFETYEMDMYDSVAEFVVEDGKVVGFGLFGTADPAMAGDRRDGVDIKNGAVAWFNKIT